MEKRYLVLESGQVFEGFAFGASGEALGEIVFATGMTGYLETLTDPSYYGQMVVQTFPLIGNYGVIPADFESPKPQVKAYIVREWCQEPSNFRSEGDLDTFLQQSGIVGLCGIDTRSLTRIIREHGVMNAKIVSSLDAVDALLPEIKAYHIANAVKNTTCQKSFRTEAQNTKKTVVLMDFGAKKNIERSLVECGCTVITVPAHTTCEEITALAPDGIMLSNGPGDPQENTEVIRELAKLTETGIPIFGICLGHQLLALAHGANTIKLKYGHRGANQPVKDVTTGHVYITSQNHGYAVDASTLPEGAIARFINANDHTCEGVEYVGKPIFTVQFHPEACGGPRDTMFLFAQFLKMMEGEAACH